MAPPDAAALCNVTESDRQHALGRWLEATLAARGEAARGVPTPLVADASARRFARVETAAGTRIVVDAPPERENIAGFLTVPAWLEARGLPAARVLAVDADAGFLLVTDLGDDTLGRRLDATPGQADTLYGAAVDALLAFQAAAVDATPPFPPYDAARLELENAIFGQWCLAGLLDLPAAPPVLTEALAALTRVHLGAPRVPVHLDWHSRNLMVAADGTIGLVDFQDARLGPQGYDLVSLLRDCYRDLPAARSAALTERFLTGARRLGLPGVDDDAAFRRVTDLVGLQRHLKAMGIFARLALRDGRDHALPDIPRTLGYVLDVAPRYPETAALGGWLAEQMQPRLASVRR